MKAKTKRKTKVKIKAKVPKEVLVVKVGSDERPASAEDIQNIQLALASTVSSKRDPNLTIVTHHAIEFQKVKYATKNKTLIVKVGNENRPAGQADIESIKTLFETAKKNKILTIVTHHALKFEYIDSKHFRPSKIECQNFSNVGERNINQPIPSTVESFGGTSSSNFGSAVRLSPPTPSYYSTNYNISPPPVDPSPIGYSTNSNGEVQHAKRMFVFVNES